jgi:hypothetical protein
VRSDTARCYYGFSSAPIEARVEVVSTNNAKQLATVLVSEKEGFIKLQADNFTFSSPTITVKLSQKSAIKVVPKKSITITCIKGNLVKKISGTAPKCPTGYKKK